MKLFVKWQFLFLLIYCLLILLIPTLLRPYTTIPGDESYELIREASLLRSGIPETDSLSYGGRPFVLSSAYPLLIAKLSQLTTVPIELLARVLPIIIGLILFTLVYFIMNRLVKTKKIILATMLIMPLSPPFLYLSYIFNYHAFPILLTMVATLCFLLKNKPLNATSILLFALLPLFGFLHAIIGFCIILAISITKNHHKKLILPILILMIITTALHFIPTLLEYGFAKGSPVVQPELVFNLKNTISDFGARFGLSIFAIMLAIVGLGELWRKKYKNSAIYLALIILIVLSIFELWTLFYLNILITMLAATGILRIIKSNWSSQVLKNLTTLILICGLIFSGLTSAHILANALPSDAMYDSFKELQKQAEGTVLSHPSNGFWILGIAKKPTFIDLNLKYAPSLDQRLIDLNTTINSRDLEVTKAIFEKYGIKYIWIDEPMRTGRVWSREEEGLLFLLLDSKTFKRIHSEDNIEIWEYIQ